MAITDWPLEERPREKLLQRGPAALSDAELLAIFLRTGVTGKTAVDLARELISQFGNLSTLLSANQKRFCQGPGLGDAKYAQLQAVLEMGRRHLFEEVCRGASLNNPAATRDYLIAQLRHQPHEVFACLFLDNRHRVICFEELFNGTIDGAAVYPRTLVKQALAHNAAAVILAHNHPSGVAEPSVADQQTTQRIQQALELVDVRVLDHFIIAGRRTVSFAERGLL